MINTRPQGSRISASLAVIALLVIVVAIIVIFYALRPVDTISVTQIVPTSNTTINRRVCITNEDCSSGLCINGVCQDVNIVHPVLGVQDGCVRPYVSILSDVLI